MKIIDYFDPTNIEHIEAYVYLEDTGQWPEGFVPDGMEFPNLWQVTLANKLASKWIEHMFNSEQEFILHWKDGKKEIIKGRNLYDAFHKAGIGQGAIGALDYWEFKV